MSPVITLRKHILELLTITDTIEVEVEVEVIRA